MDNPLPLLLLATLVAALLLAAGYLLHLWSSNSKTRTEHDLLLRLSGDADLGECVTELERIVEKRFAALEKTVATLADVNDRLDVNVGKLVVALTRSGALRALELAEPTTTGGSWGAARSPDRPVPPPRTVPAEIGAAS